MIDNRARCRWCRRILRGDRERYCRECARWCERPSYPMIDPYVVLAAVTHTLQPGALMHELTAWYNEQGPRVAHALLRAS